MFRIIAHLIILHRNRCLTEVCSTQRTQFISIKRRSNMFKAKQIRLRRRTLQQMVDDDDKVEETEDDDEENPIDIEFLKQNLKTVSTAVNDDELMPEATQKTPTQSKSRSKKKTPQMQVLKDQQEMVTDIQSDQGNENQSNSLPEAGKRRRGRPRKNTSAQAPEFQRDSYQTQTDRVKDNQSNLPSAAATRRRGRPRKRKEAPASIENLSEEFHEQANGDVELTETNGCSPDTGPIHINTADVNRAISLTDDQIRPSANGLRAMFPINSTLQHTVATMKNILSSDDESVQGDGEIENDTEIDVASAAQSTTVDGEDTVAMTDNDHVNTNVIDAMPDALQILKRTSNSDRYVALGDESVMEYDKDNAFMTDNDDQYMGNIDMFPSVHQILQKNSNPDRDVALITLSTEVCGKDSEFITEKDFENMSDIDIFPNDQQILQTTSNHDTYAALADKSATAYEKNGTFVLDNDDESISYIEMFPEAQQLLQKSSKPGNYVTLTNFSKKVHEKDSAVITEDDHKNMGDIDLLWDVQQILPETSNSDRCVASADVLSTISKNYNFHLKPTNISSTSDNATIGLDNVVQLLENRPIIANCSESTIRTTNTDSSTSLVTCSSKEKKKRRRLPRKRCEIQTCRARFRVRRLDCRHRFCVPCIRSLKKRRCPKCSTPIGNYLPPNKMGGENWENEMETEEPLFNAIRQGIDNCNFITL
uniref:RING-type domain-containing protein n=1 Tax=Trichogramma kaykai TaxID=54128 RepID=A0ABD2W3P5_9HYME